MGRRLLGILPEVHAYGGLVLASIGAGLLFGYPAGLLVGGAGLFYLAHVIGA